MLGQSRLRHGEQSELTNVKKCTTPPKFDGFPRCCHPAGTCPAAAGISPSPTSESSSPTGIFKLKAGPRSPGSSGHQAVRARSERPDIHSGWQAVGETRIMTLMIIINVNSANWAMDPDAAALSQRPSCSGWAETVEVPAAPRDSGSVPEPRSARLRRRPGLEYSVETKSRVVSLHPISSHGCSVNGCERQQPILKLQYYGPKYCVPFSEGNHFKD